MKMKTEELTYENFLKLVKHSGTPLYDENGEDGDNIVGYICPYCNEVIMFEDYLDAKVEKCECPNCHVKFVEG